MPIEAELRHTVLAEVARDDTRATLNEVNLGGRYCYVIESTDVDAGCKLFEQLYASLPMSEGQAEPMMNVLCRAENQQCITVVIPRRNHRPACCNAEGESRMLISPASVDLGGVVIASRKEDFERITAEDIAAIFSEVCITDADVACINDKLNKKGYKTTN